jgi:hypothetical protein
MPLGLSKKYDEAAEAVLKYLKDPITTKDKRKIGDEEQDVIKVVGTYSHFDLMDMDQYHWKLKFEFFDCEPKTEDMKKFRGEMAMNNPEMAAMFTSKTSMFVYREVEKEIITKIDGKVTDTKKTTDWIDFTREWVTKLQRQDAFMKG